MRAIVERRDLTVFPRRIPLLEERTPCWIQCSDGLCNTDNTKKGKGSPYSITERRVPELIMALGRQPAGDVNHKPGGRLPLLSAGMQLPPQPLTGLLPILLLVEQRQDGCEQFA